MLDFIRINQIKRQLKIPLITQIVEKKSLSFRLQEEERFFQFWKDRSLSKINFITTLITVASVSNNLSWVFFSAYQCAIRYHFKQKFNGTISLAVKGLQDAPMETTYQRKKDNFSFRGQKSWLVSTNVDMILLFVKLNKTIVLSVNSGKTILTSVLAPIFKEKSVTRMTFEKRKFLKQLNQGNLTLRNTKILSENIISGKNIRGFGASEQFFVMLSLGIFFVTKIKNAKIRKKFFKVIQALIIDFNTRYSLKLTVKNHKKNFRKMIYIFDNLPERKVMAGWELDKIIFLNLLK